ncbi:protoheme IX farnesyltransferase [Evansella caseinilytica]|uniref:Protoheme IX farnesyltransferase n=1 Tax=Evansella caseinilytica TaxID=1503961 RepID=A0A1H3MU68_9BACI|nr:heme o synthase [Evansella caseinilytica]SDY80221.1 protoheme IX farnesyltransferase [Evansella caseinilytica]
MKKRERRFFGRKTDHARFASEKKKVNFVSDIISLVKFGVLLSNVFPVFTGFWLALVFTERALLDHWSVLLFTLAGSTLVMAGALIINNWYDADIDSLMARTKSRPTVTGSIPPQAVWISGVATTVGGFVFLTFTTMEATIYAFVGWFTYVVLYTMWSKRRYTWNTAVGSISGAVTPMIGWAAVAKAFHPVPLLLFLLLFLWQMPHTYAIAIRRYEEYKAAGVAMLPVVRGIRAAKWQISFYVVWLLPVPFLLGALGPVFVTAGTLLNIGWIVFTVSGFYTKDNVQWAYLLFLYSVGYLMLLFLVMIIVTLPVFR